MASMTPIMFYVRDDDAKEFHEFVKKLVPDVPPKLKWVWEDLVSASEPLDEED